MRSGTKRSGDTFFGLKRRTRRNTIALQSERRTDKRHYHHGRPLTIAETDGKSCLHFAMTANLPPLFPLCRRHRDMGRSCRGGLVLKSSGCRFVALSYHPLSWPAHSQSIKRPISNSLCLPMALLKMGERMLSLLAAERLAWYVKSHDSL